MYGIPIWLIVRIAIGLFACASTFTYVKHREHVAAKAAAKAAAERVERSWRAKLADAEKDFKAQLKEIAEFARKDIEAAEKRHDETKTKLSEISIELDKVLTGPPAAAWPSPVVTQLRNSARAINRRARR